MARIGGLYGPAVGNNSTVDGANVYTKSPSYAVFKGLTS